MNKNELRENGYMSLLAICKKAGRDKELCKKVPQEILNLATILGRERYFSPKNIPVVEKFFNLSVRERQETAGLPAGYKTLTTIMKEFKSSYVPPKELLLDEIVYKGHKYYGEKTIEAIRKWLFEYENLTNVTLRVLGYKFDQNLIPEELKAGGIHKGNGMAYPPETIENISKWLMEYMAIPMDEKKRQTNLEKYGVENPQRLEKTKERMKATNLERYGVENPFQAEQFKEKSRQTCLAKYGVECYAKTEESRKVTGVRLNSPEMIEKRFATNLEKYGSTCPMQSEENKEKIKKTFLEKYGQETYMGSEDFKQKVKETVKEKYGVDNVSQLEEVKLKKEETSMEHYGVKYYMQSEEYKSIPRKPSRYSYDGQKFDSSWELAFYYFLKKKGVEFEFQPVDAKIDYMYNGEKHTYYPDFRVGNQIIEIKGNQFFDENGKMINPFDRSQDELFEAKHQCMLQNNVRILTEKELDKIIDLAYNELGDLRQFRTGGNE